MKISDEARALFNVLPIGECDPEQYLRAHRIIEYHLRRAFVQGRRQERRKRKDAR